MVVFPLIIPFCLGEAICSSYFTKNSAIVKVSSQYAIICDQIFTPSHYLSPSIIWLKHEYTVKQSKCWMQKRKGNEAEAIKHRVEHTGAHPPVPLPVSEWKFGTTGSYHVSLLKGETPFLSFHLLLPQFCHQLIFLLTSPPAFSSVGVAQLPRSTNHNVHKTVFLFPTAFSRSLLITAH